MWIYSKAIVEISPTQMEICCPPPALLAKPDQYFNEKETVERTDSNQ